jgi:protein arginine kinase
MSNPSKGAISPIKGDNPWSHNANLVWLGSTVTLLRNIEKYNFPGKLSADKRKQVLSLLREELIAALHPNQPKFVPAEEISPTEKEYLVEHFLATQSFLQAHSGEAFVLDETGEFLVVVNLKDHLQLLKIDVKDEIEASWDALMRMETKINQSINFAFNTKFGFLTSDATQCGTGLVVKIFLHLPALSHSDLLQEILDKHQEEGLIWKGLQDDPNEIIGDIFVLQNHYTLGLTEENILSSLRLVATKIMVAEKSHRQLLKHKSEEELAGLKDKVSRAFGLLMHSYKIEAIEALDAVSLLKLGLDLGWLKGVDQAILNQLFFSCRRGHLLCYYGEQIKQDDLPHKRAEFIHRTLEGLTLLI